MNVEEFQACLSIRHTRGIGPRTWRDLLNAYGTAAAAVADAQMWHLRGVAGKGQVRRFLSGDWKPAAEKELQECRRAGMQVLCLSDPGFPELLKNISDPPLYLYVHGDLSLLDNPAVAVVGARRCTRYSTKVARKLGSDLAMAGITVVSGLADGIDRYAHLGSIDRPGRSVAVLGTGLDLIYPARNRDLWERMSEQGLIVTEFPPGTRPDGPNFPHRNRIISGLSLGVVVVQAAVKSGTLITARLAMEQGREVLVVPGPVDGPGYEGSHQLVRDGAALVRGGEDIILELASILESRYPHLGGGITGSAVIPRNEDRVAAMELSGEERQVVDRLLRAGKQQIETLGIALDWDASRLSRVLLMLELKGVVRQLPGMIYEMAEPG